MANPEPDWGFLSQSSWEEAHRAYKQNIIQMVSPRWAVLSWAYRLFRAPRPSPEQCDFRISIAEMQRMYMAALQGELVDLGIQLRWPDDLSKTVSHLPAVLEKYSQAVRDYDYMITATQKPLDAFVISAERALDRDLLFLGMDRAHKSRRDICPPSTTSNAALSLPSSITDTGPWERPSRSDLGVAPTGGTRGANVKSLTNQAFWGRLSAALVAAAFLVGPMWLLVLRREEIYVHLGATTGFVFAFGFALAFFVEKMDQVFAGTLAYAAVLMVFVGVIMQGAG